MFSEVMRYILDLGPTVMLPIVIIIFSKILGMKAGDCFKAGLHIGIGFVGIGLVIGLMLDSSMISQYLPKQFERIQSGELSAIPHQLIMDKIYDVLRAYRYGCAE